MSASTVIGQLGWTLLHFVWQGTLIACLAAVGLLVLRNARPQARYALACGALLACLAWPAADLLLRLCAPAPGGGAGTAPLFTAGVSSGAGLPLAWLQGQLGAIVLAWAACAAALSARMVVGLCWIGRAGAGGAAAPHWQARMELLARQLGITQALRLRVVDTIASPITAGWWRPLVLLPSSLLTGMPPDLLEALIAHELAHVKRADYLVNLLQNVVETLLFYHPAVWYLSARIRIEREQIADDLAAHYVGKRRLARALSELEKIQFSHTTLALAATGGELMVRIKRLLRPDAQRLDWKAALPVLGLATALVAGCAQAPLASHADSTSVRTKAIVNFASCAKPVWPQASLRAEHTGTVKLAFLVDATGKVIDSRVDQLSGHVTLDEAARSGIALCSFRPALENGVAVQAWSPLAYTWALK
ncbi:TonB family protein [Massilia sp. DWR3-1-1]|uniref:TonB family protein n=1 Tax=Massilia sp. DWR3-1-1 TaxID=2804559 RepID=UPI003CF9E073